MVTALIQAGGKSQRMRRTSGPVHKALLPVVGVPILERNICRLLAVGFDSLVVVAAQGEQEILDFVAERGSRLARSRGASIRCLVESQPLGTIGASGLLRKEDCPILVLYSDNLTSLDMRTLVEFHEQAAAAMTLATHEEPFQIPYGEVISSDGRVIDYREKSIHPIRVSSGIYVIGATALARFQVEERIDSPQLVHRLLKHAELVVDYPHNELWIDMNDSSARARLEKLVTENPEQLEWLQPRADREGCLLVQHDPRRMPQESTVSAIKPGQADKALVCELGSFDEIDEQDGRIVRWSVFLWVSGGDMPIQGESLDANVSDSCRRRAIARAEQHLHTHMHPT